MTTPSHTDEKKKVAQAPEAFESLGKRVHNEVTYRGVDWILNASVGVTFAYWASRTKSGAKYFSEPVANFFRKILKPIFKSEATVEEGAKWGSMFASIMFGGTATIPPIMILENKKVKKSIIKTLDEKIYGKDEVAADPRFEESYKAIDEEPQKDFATGMITRFASLAPLIAITVSPANKYMVQYLYNPIAKATKWGAEKIGIKPGKFALRGTMEHVEGDIKAPKKFLSDWDFIHQTIGFDFGLSFFYAYIHEAVYKAMSCWEGGGDKSGKPGCQNKTSAAIEALDTAAHGIPNTIVTEAQIAKHTAEAIEKSAEKFAHKRHPMKHENFTDYAKQDAIAPTLGA
jgi:hypothetical protein